MKYKSYITQLTHKFFKKEPALRDPQLMHPDREWATGLSIAVLIFSVCGLWSIHSYFENRAVTTLPVEDSSRETVYRESVVKEALSKINEQKDTFNALTSGINTPVVANEATSTPPAEVEIVVPPEEPVSDTSLPTLGD